MLMLKALGVGMVFGFLVCYFKLPMPAPTHIAGVMGIVGLWLGYILYNFTLGN